ncbi:hypothetical protein NQ314_019569 [Rhamnusium bicolor]|uniref:Zinc carboxypeptidase A 1 n=1 Tax=Rhamnusium bicolor TaxID=1586634 RepID=A0AAV8WN37_9CUCU|nr:hypothetical protein NQ314_019569 [Rhamnusium bicolor]
MNFLITLVLFLTIGHSISEKVRYDNYKLYRLTPKNAQALQALKDLEETEYSEYNFWNSVRTIGVPVDVMAPPSRVDELENMVKSLDMDSKLLMENVQDQIDAEHRPQTRENEVFGWTRVTSAVSSYILNEILTSTNETVRRMATSHDWYVFPIFNPDGFVYSHTTDRMWRKTRVPHSILCTGADPNRNWDYYWNHGGTSNSPCTDTYRGPAPFSEPSCKSMADFISTIGHQLVAYLSFHSYSQLLLLPYGYTNEHLENYDQAYEIGLKSVEALAQRYGTQYRVGTVYEIIYPASGSSADWVKGVFKTPLVYGYELRDQGQYGFLLPPEQIIPTAEETLDSVITMLREYENSINS